MAAKLEISNLRVVDHAASGPAVPAIDEVDTSPAKSDFVPLTGRNGYGKSTVFNVIAGLTVPNAGMVALDGMDIIGRPGSISAVEGLRKKYAEFNESEAIANLAEIARISQSADTKQHGLGWQDPAV
jgi:ABC-type branched-subunit amino acid transport system ATPase component